MIRRRLFLSVALYILFNGFIKEAVAATSGDNPRPFEENYLEIGY